jgi:hypothetical protein
MAECPQAELVYGYVSRASGHMKDVMVAVTREDGPCTQWWVTRRTQPGPAALEAIRRRADMI